MVLLTLLGLSALLLTERKKVKNTNLGQDEKVDQTDVLPVGSSDGQTSQHIISDPDPEVLPTVEEPITAHPEIDDDDVFQDCVCDSAEWNVDIVHALNSVMCDFHVNSLDFNAPQLPVSAVSDCKVDVPQASDSPTENTVASQSSLDNGLQDYTEPLPLEQQHQHLENKERDGASDNETKPDYRVPEVLIPTNDTPDFLSRVHSGLSSQWMTLAMISFIFITIYLGLKALIMCVLCVQIKCLHQIIRIGYNVYRCYYIPWFRILSWYFLLCVIYFFFGETVMDYFFAPVQREEYVHMLSEYHPFISSALYLAGFCMFVLCLVKKQFRQPFYMFACTHVILLNVAIHASLIIRDPYKWMMWFIVPISCVICNNIMVYVFGFFSGSTPLI